MDQVKLDAILDNSENDSSVIDAYVSQLVGECCNNLDKYVEYVFEVLNKDDVITDEDLDDIVLTIPPLIYFAGEVQEKLGIRQDVSETTRKSLYNKIYVDTTGTAQVRKSTAEMQLSDYEIASIIYERAYETIDHKISYAKELLQSAKRVLSRRIASIEISKLSER